MNGMKGKFLFLWLYLNNYQNATLTFNKTLDGLWGSRGRQMALNPITQPLNHPNHRVKKTLVCSAIAYTISFLLNKSVMFTIFNCNTELAYQ